MSPSGSSSKIGEPLLPDPGPLLRSPLPRRYASMTVHAGVPVGGFLFFWRISLAVSPKRPGPPSRYHHRLQVIVAGKALRHRSVVASVVLAGDRPASDEILKRLLRQRSRMPLPIVAGLALLGRVDAEQPHELGAELYGIAVHNLEPGLSGPNHSVIVGLCSRGQGKDKCQETKSPQDKPPGLAVHIGSLRRACSFCLRLRLLSYAHIP